jgi:hypothetical protein
MALKIAWKCFCKLFRPSWQNQKDSLPWVYGLPEWVGLWATLNGLGFIVAGVILPWILTDGALGAPEVRSRQTYNCQDAWAKGFPGEFINSNLMLSSSIWEQCHDEKNDNSYCDPNFAGIGAYVPSFKSGCIFPSQICLKDQPIATFTRANVTAHDLGINSIIKMTFSHRIHCSPISLEPFIRKSNLPANVTDYGNFTLSIQDPRSYNLSDFSKGLQLGMWTDNSPDSGLEIWKRRSPFYSFQVLPGIQSRVNLESTEGTNPPLRVQPPEHIHPLLRVPNARAFVLVFKAGGLLYDSSSPITDPLFAAHKFLYSKYYYADREATGIGCGEQTQFCVEFLSGIKCYPWTKSLWDFPRHLGKDVQQLKDPELPIEFARVFMRNLENTLDNGLQYFLQRRLHLPNPLLVRPMAIDVYRNSFITDIDIEHQWISELGALFDKAMYWQKITTLAVVQNTLDRKFNTPIDPRIYSLCDKILFIDADFTNINWIGMWISVGVLLLFCMISYGISLLTWASENKVNLLNREVWRQLRINTSKWVQKMSDRIGGISHQDSSVKLGTLSIQAPRSPDEEPDDPV